MADLLPSIPDASAPEDAEPRVVGLEDEAAEEVLGALSSTTARELFATINEEPGHPAALADRVDTSLQNVQYHLGKLDDAGMVEVVDTAYSAKGREMDVYAPADRALVLFAGDEEDQSLLNRALGRLLGGIGVLAGATLAVRGLVSAERAANADSADGYTSVTGAEGQGSGQSGGGDSGGGGSDSGGGDSGGADSGGTGDGASGNGSDGATGGGNQSADAPSGGDADAAVGGDGANLDFHSTGAEDHTVEPLAQDAAWLVQPLDATGLSPALFVLLVGSCLLAIAVGVWYWRNRPTAESQTLV